MKAIIRRCSKQNEELAPAIAAWRNMARADGTSPCQLFYGRRLRQQLPMTREHLETQPQSTDGRDKTTRKAEKYRNAHTTKKQDLRPGQLVLMQNHLSGKWDRQVEVIKKREKGDSYDVRTDAGKTYVLSLIHI